jgi:archaeosine-15-forming tRNA-guanine transglycosylase
MSEMKTGYLKIQFNNGTMQRFEYERAEEKSHIAERIREMLQSGTLILQIPGPNRILVIPFSSIQSVEVVPPPPKMPGVVIKVVREMDQL